LEKEEMERNNLANGLVNTEEEQKNLEE